MSKGIQGSAASVNRDNMGAFSDNLDVVDRLFYAGIPVWYTRPVSQSLDVRIDKVSMFIIEDYYQKIELHTGYTVDLADSQPSARVIYTGLANKPERYQAMANFVHSLLQYPSLFGSSEPRSSTSLIRTSLSSSSVVPGSSQATPCKWSSKISLFKLSNISMLSRFKNRESSTIQQAWSKYLPRPFVTIDALRCPSVGVRSRSSLHLQQRCSFARWHWQRISSPTPTAFYQPPT